MSAKSAASYCKARGIVAPNYIVYEIVDTPEIGKSIRIVDVFFSELYAKEVVKSFGPGYFYVKVKEPER